MATTAASSLNFRVFHCSSQDPQFPVNELLNNAKDQSLLRGWQSQRFCVYPQEIVLQFPCLVHLKQVQILIHESKIPSKIELFSYAPDFAAGAGSLVSLSNPQVSFTRLGHFSLDDNIRSNFQAREFKTVYLEQYCQYLKLQLHKNHLNHINIFNQVGIVSISCIGSYMGDYEVAMISTKPAPLFKSGFPGDFQQDPNLMPRNLKISSVNDEELDPTLQDKIRTLNAAKQKAVETDDFDKAKNLKEVIDKLRIAGSQLLQLEIQKKLAIENEDFDSAKVLKYEIDRLRSLAMSLDTDRVILTPIRQNRNMMPMPEQYNENFEDMRSQRPIEGQNADEEYRSQVNEQLEESKEEDGKYLKMERSFKQDDQITERSGLPLQKSFARNNDEMIVPAHNMKKLIDFNTVNEEEFFNGVNKGNDGKDEEYQIHHIPQSQRPIADAMLPLFGEEITLLVFGRTWQNREKGISSVINKLNDVLTKDQENVANTCILQLITECLKDKVQQVTLKSFLLVEAYITVLQKNKNINPKAEISNTEKMLAQLLDKLADSKFQQKAEQAYLKFFLIEQLEGNFLIGFLLKNSSYLNKKLAQSFKHIVPRLQILNNILTDFQKYEQQKKTSATTFPFNALFSKVKEGIEASNQDQRKLSQQIIITVYQKFGFKKIEPLINDLPVKSLDMLLKDIPEVETYMKMKKQSGKKE